MERLKVKECPDLLVPTPTYSLVNSSLAETEPSIVVRITDLKPVNSLARYFSNFSLVILMEVRVFVVGQVVFGNPF
jgi:hypothetical protein